MEPHLVDPGLFSTAILVSLLLICLAFLVFVLSKNIYLLSQRPYPGIPLIGSEQGVVAAKARYIKNSVSMISSALSQCDGAFQMFTDIGPRIMLPVKYIEEIKNNDVFSNSEFLKEDFLIHYPLFGGGQRHNGMLNDVLQDTIRSKLTRQLGRINEGLSEEAELVIAQLFPPCEEYQEGPLLYQTIVHIVARLSARVFLGPTMCRNPAWLQVSASYAISFMQGVNAVRAYPAVLRPVVMMFLPQLKQLKNERRTALKLLQEEQNRRQRSSVDGKQDMPAGNMMDWFHEVAAAKGKTVDPATGQLAVAFAAIHTTSVALTNTLLDIVAHPKLADELRAEIVANLGPELQGKGGWTKTNLQHLRLMDSVMKESQRCSPGEVITMRRKTVKEYSFSDGTYVPAGSSIALPTESFQKSDIYDHPEHFDGHRFLRLRGGSQPGSEQKWQYITTSPEMFGFGHGRHACPGRFFASNEIKVALVHLLMKYDWKFEGPKQGIAGRPLSMVHVDLRIPDPTRKLVYRSRKCEIQL